MAAIVGKIRERVHRRPDGMTAAPERENIGYDAVGQEASTEGRPGSPNPYPNVSLDRSAFHVTTGRGTPVTPVRRSSEDGYRRNVDSRDGPQKSAHRRVVSLEQQQAIVGEIIPQRDSSRRVGPTSLEPVQTQSTSYSAGAKERTKHTKHMSSPPSSRAQHNTPAHNEVIGEIVPNRLSSKHAPTSPKRRDYVEQIRRRDLGKDGPEGFPPRGTSLGLRTDRVQHNHPNGFGAPLSPTPSIPRKPVPSPPLEEPVSQKSTHEPAFENRADTAGDDSLQLMPQEWKIPPAIPMRSPDREKSNPFASSASGTPMRSPDREKSNPFASSASGTPMRSPDKEKLNPFASSASGTPMRSPDKEKSNPFALSGTTYVPPRDEAMEATKAKAIASGHLHLPDRFNLQNTVQTHVTEELRPAVTHETIIHKRTEIVHEEITRDIHYHHYYTYLQPVKVVEILPAKHFVVDPETGIKTEIPPPPGWQLPINMTPTSLDTSVVKGWTRHYLVNAEHPNGILEDPPQALKHEHGHDNLRQEAIDTAPE